MIDEPENNPGGPDEVSFSQAEAMSELEEPLRAEINAEIGLEGAMDEARPYFLRLMKQLLEPLKRGDYTSVLGDDVTGRLPALVVGDIANRLADDDGRAHPAHLFFAGGAPGIPTLKQSIELGIELEEGDPEYTPTGIRKVSLTENQRNEHRDKLLDEYFDRLRPQLGERVLFVTDRISSGETVERVARLLHQKDVAFDVATLGERMDLQEYINLVSDRPEFSGVRWFSGGDKTEDGVLFSRQDSLEENKLRQQIGVEKNWLQPRSKRIPNFDVSEVSRSRALMSQYSNELYESLVSGSAGDRSKGEN